MSIEQAMQFSPAAERNKDAILAVLQRRLAARGTALEIASGSGQHVVHFAAALPGWTWQPTDAEPAALASIAARRAQRAAANVLAPLRLDVTAARWPLAAFDLVLCANMVHIAPWDACLGLLAGAAAHLEPAGQLLLYGPYLVAGEPAALSNLAFDADLRARNPQWGLRQVEDVVAAAAAVGLALRERAPMPANNQILAFTRAPAGGPGS